MGPLQNINSNAANSSKSPLISIVVPTFNQGRFIEDCLNSILQQSESNLEILIQDSLSTDETESICNQFAKKDPRVKYFREKDQGQTDAINRGLKKSSGVFWTWLCSDDRYAQPDALGGLVRFWKQNTDKTKHAIGVFGQARYISEQGVFVAPYSTTERTLTKKDFQFSWPLSQPASLLLREGVVEVGGCDASLHLGMDLDLFAKILRDDHCLLFHPTVVAEVRLQGESKSVKFRRETALNALRLIHLHFGSLGPWTRSAYAWELRSSGTAWTAIRELAEIEGYFKALIQGPLFAFWTQKWLHATLWWVVRPYKLTQWAYWEFLKFQRERKNKLT